MQEPLKISIINKPSAFFFKRCGVFYAKKIIRSLLGIQRGPDVVVKSLVRGLASTNTIFNVNPSKSKLHKIVHVLSNPVALEWAIKQKKLGHIDTLIAGPNISILPSFDNFVFNNPEIDLILLPSEWTKDAYIKDSPVIAPRIQVWPSGVEIPSDSETGGGSSKDFYLIFKKTFSDTIYNKIVAKLSAQGVPFKSLVYGTFKQEEYFELLKKAKGMIYLQMAESQGIALQEAWARNVPTLVWDSKSYTYEKAHVTVEGKVSAPYLTDESGVFFGSLEEFDQKFNEFNTKLDNFRARDYCIRELSDQASAQKYIEFISKVQK